MWMYTVQYVMFYASLCKIGGCPQKVQAAQGSQHQHLRRFLQKGTYIRTHSWLSFRPHLWLTSGLMTCIYLYLI